MSISAHQFRDFSAEAFFVRRLKEHGRQVFAGVTDPATRRERIRKAILDAKLDQTIIGRSPGGKAETYAAAFARYYGTPLHAEQTA